MKTVTAESIISAQIKDVLSNDTKTKTHFIGYVADLKKHNANSKTLSDRYSAIKAFIKALNADDNHKKLVQRTVSLAYDYLSFNLVAKFDELHFSTIEQAVKVAKTMQKVSKGDGQTIGAVQLTKHNADNTKTLVTLENALKELKKEIADVYNRPEFKGVTFTTQLKTDYNNAVSKVIHAVSSSYKIIEDENGVMIKLTDITSSIEKAMLTADDINELMQLLNAKKEELTAVKAS